MPNATENFKINLNQNLWGLVVGLAALGVAERYSLSKLACFGLFISGLMSLSLLATTISYTFKYCREKALR
jgi:hypothetical protein